MQVGLDRASAAEYLSSNQGHDEVSSHVQASLAICPISGIYCESLCGCRKALHQAGIHSIPVFLFSEGERSWTVHGSSNVREFSKLFAAMAR